jgi:type II secretory pathway component PulF
MGERVTRAWLRHPMVAFLRHRRLVTFYQQLHALIRAGTPLPTAFLQLTRYAPDSSLAKGLTAVGRDVREGHSLGDALRRHGALFDDANVELIAFAEEAGRLEAVTATIISHLQKVQALRWQALMGALWPLYLGAALILGGPLLGVARNVSGSCSAAGCSVGSLYVRGLAGSLAMTLTMVVVLVGAPLLIAALKLERGWERALRNIPFLSAPMRQLAASRFVMGLGLATASGMEVGRALRLAAKSTSSLLVWAQAPRAEATLRSGSTLAEAVATFGLLDRSSLGTLAVAETTGTLDHALERLSGELQDSSLRATRLLIVLTTVAMAGLLLAKIVSGLVGVLFGPIRSLYEAAGSGRLDG